MRLPSLAVAASLLLALGSPAQPADDCLPIVHEPPAGKALVNLHYTFGPPWINVWHEEVYLTTLYIGNVLQVAVDPGEHLFVASLAEAGRKGAVLADVEAGRVYDADIEVLFRVRMTPAVRGSKLRASVAQRIERECRVGTRFPDIPGLSVGIDPPIEEVVERFRSGKWKRRVSRLRLEDGRPGGDPSDAAGP